LLSFLAVRFLSSMNVFLMPCVGVWKTLLFSFGMLFSMAASFGVIGRIRLLLFFSAFIVIVRRVVSICDHSRGAISPIRAPVSLSSCMSVAVVGLADAMRLSISCSVGMYGGVNSRLYCGSVHVLFMDLRYPL